MQVTLYNKPQSLDDMVVDMARVSFNKTHSDYTEEQNTKLINYLMKHWHYTPFAHPTLSIVIEEIGLEELFNIVTNKELSAGLHISEYEITGDKVNNLHLTGSIYALFQLFYSHLHCPSMDEIFKEHCPISRYAYISRCVDNGGAFNMKRKYKCTIDDTNNFTTLHIKAPIFVARQLGKHQVGFVWNEISRRYVNSDPEFFEPKVWRGAAENKKQGSSSDSIKNFNHSIKWASGDPITSAEFCKIMYKNALNLGVCEEQSRMILPQSMMTEWYMTANTDSWNRLLNLRLKEDTQLETRLISLQIESTLNHL